MARKKKKFINRSFNSDHEFMDRSVRSSDWPPVLESLILTVLEKRKNLQLFPCFDLPYNQTGNTLSFFLCWYYVTISLRNSIFIVVRWWLFIWRSYTSIAPSSKYSYRPLYCVSLYISVHNILWSYDCLMSSSVILRRQIHDYARISTNSTISYRDLSKKSVINKCDWF